MNKIASILCALLLCSCQTDPNAGMVAARITGQSEYLAFSRNGKADSAAVFALNGENWLYHPEFGSVRIGDHDPLTLIPHSFRSPVLCVPRDADLLNGCLPRAVEKVRKRGGRVGFTTDQKHAYAMH